MPLVPSSFYVRFEGHNEDALTYIYACLLHHNVTVCPQRPNNRGGTLGCSKNLKEAPIHDAVEKSESKLRLSKPPVLSRTKSTLQYPRSHLSDSSKAVSCIFLQAPCWSPSSSPPLIMTPQIDGIPRPPPRQLRGSRHKMAHRRGPTPLREVSSIASISQSHPPTVRRRRTVAPTPHRAHAQSPAQASDQSPL